MKNDTRTVFVPELNGSIDFTPEGGSVRRPKDNFFIAREGKTDDQIINEALDIVQRDVRRTEHAIQRENACNPVVAALIDGSEVL